MLRIMSFDPGLANLGYGSVETNDNGETRLGRYFGVLRTTVRDGEDRARIDKQGAAARAVLEKYRPDAVGLEDWDHRGANPKEATTTPVLIEHLRLICRDLEIPCYLFDNAVWKKATLGIRSASKTQVMHYVRKRVPESETILHRVPDHAWDAVGVCFAVLKQLKHT